MRTILFAVALLFAAVTAQAQTFETAQCSSDRICAAVPMDTGGTATVNASAKAAPACSVSVDGTTYTGTCQYGGSYGAVQFTNGYSYYQDVTGAVCSLTACKTLRATFEFKQTRTVSGRYAGRVQTFWWITGGQFQ